MKIAISATGTDLESDISTRFGRCHFFLIVDTKTKEVKAIVNEVNEEVIGHLRVFPPWYGQKGRHVGEIGLLIIKPWRERGIGTAMVSYALEWAKIANFQKLIASVFSTNHRALNLFFKFDFFEEGRRVRQLNINENYVDEILVGRFIL